MIRFAALGLMVGALLVLSLPAAAQDVDCTRAETQVALTFCAGQDGKAADDRLTSAYKAAMAVMKGIDANLDVGNQVAVLALRDGQRAWITFRDATCAAEGWTFHGGSAEPMVIYACRARVTAARAAELENMAAAD